MLNCAEERLSIAAHFQEEKSFSGNILMILAAMLDPESLAK